MRPSAQLRCDGFYGGVFVTILLSDTYQAILHYVQIVHVSTEFQSSNPDRFTEASV
jgi:hypothetical protein